MADVDATSEPVVFDVEEHSFGVLVTILCLTGESITASVREDVTIDQLKLAVAEKLQIGTDDFALVDLNRQASLGGDVVVSSCAEGGESVSLLMARHTTLEKYEIEAGNAWQEMARTLQDVSVDDATAHEQLREFLTSYPALINYQMFVGSEKKFKPLLSFAVEGIKDVALRQKCVDELIARGARVHTRHAHGFLIEEAEASESAFVPYLKGKVEELKTYETEAIAAWRNVSSKLCGETRFRVSDENEMTQIVEDFCVKYPNMVNFQNNHACDDETDRPYGYFGYAPLLAFSGGRACRARRGAAEEETHITRLGSFQTLLKHGARVDIQHGGKDVLEWMRDEGSGLVEWLEEQFKKPMPEHVPFEFCR
eukprot:TRINITY_DN78287_c0_g1_i1.p1 TRINITY_DN78287_c0_g1~~TRINITY_DN78287_c0_g1_i1.p1  ORF type:complete len:368 (-),score=65.73 TRINITY_DN78287_c0_g1_i1:68-1171(-)